MIPVLPPSPTGDRGNDQGRNDDEVHGVQCAIGRTAPVEREAENHEHGKGPHADIAKRRPSATHPTEHSKNPTPWRRSGSLAPQRHAAPRPLAARRTRHTTIETTPRQPHADRELEDEKIQEADMRDLATSLAPYVEGSARGPRGLRDVVPAVA
jgi:hypothetical protein